MGQAALLLALGPDPAYQAAMRKLYADDGTEVELNAAPALKLPAAKRGLIAYDPAAGKLSFTGPLSADQAGAAQNLSAAANWHTAVDSLLSQPAAWLDQQLPGVGGLAEVKGSLQAWTTLDLGGEPVWLDENHQEVRLGPDGRPARPPVETVPARRLGLLLQAVLPYIQQNLGQRAGEADDRRGAAARGHDRCEPAQRRGRKPADRPER